LTTATPVVERIIGLLTTAGFRSLDTPIAIAGVKFDFDAVLLGTGLMPDLVIVVDTTIEKEERVRTKMEAVARALDVVRSKRPLTVILAGPRPRTPTLEAISKVCRVLPIGTLSGSENDEVALKNWLAVLMPLTLPQARDVIADPMSKLLESVDQNDPIVLELLAEAPNGVEGVQEAFHNLVRQPLNDAEVNES
jgi:hypothetical protein